jgi:hypothetical protein
MPAVARPAARPAAAAAACAAVAALAAGAPPASATVSSRLTAPQVLAEAVAGRTAATILGESFPGAALRPAPNPRIRVLVADLAPRVIVAARTRPTLIVRRARIALRPDHRYEITRAGRRWRMRDLDGGLAARPLPRGPVRIVSTAARPDVLMADPLGRRFRGSLVLRPGDGKTIAVVNEVAVEQWIRGTAAGDVPADWLSGAPGAMDVAAVLARSRALAAAGGAGDGAGPGYDLTSDDPLYLGLEGESPPSVAAAGRTRGQALMTGTAPVDGVVPIAGGPAPAAMPDPGRPLPVALAPARPIPGAPAGLGPRAVALAQGRLGTPYRWGGSAPGGFDCSGLVYWAYRTLGITLPRVAEDQGTVGVPVAEADLQPGDVVFFADSSGYVHHEGIYVGGGRMIHAPQTGEVVRVERIDTGYYARQYAGARRFSPPA